MKLSLTFAALLFASVAFAQVPGKKSAQPYTLNGNTYSIGDTIYFETGSMPNGDFKYVYYRSGSNVEYLRSTSAGTRLQITHFKVDSSKNTGSKTYVIVKPNMFPFAIDLEQALKAGEIRVGHIKK